MLSDAGSIPAISTTLNTPLNFEQYCWNVQKSGIFHVRESLILQAFYLLGSGRSYINRFTKNHNSRYQKAKYMSFEHCVQLLCRIIFLAISLLKPVGCFICKCFVRAFSIVEKHVIINALSEFSLGFIVYPVQLLSLEGSEKRFCYRIVADDIV